MGFAVVSKIFEQNETPSGLRTDLVRYLARLDQEREDILQARLIAKNNARLAESAAEPQNAMLKARKTSPKPQRSLSLTALQSSSPA